nr:MAG TPA: hypothetical protein [Caudoviricetes sp.]
MHPEPRLLSPASPGKPGIYRAGALPEPRRRCLKGHNLLTPQQRPREPFR